MDELAYSFATVLRLLVDRDPQVNRTFDHEIEKPGWQFCFNGVRMFVSVFSPIYEPSHPRHATSGTFVVFQPESSFDLHLIGSAFTSSDRVKRQIRGAFARKGYEYPHSVIDARIEARIYLLPRHDGDEGSAWWLYIRNTRQLSLFG
jgi:FPC/CPF motif-containing protein YcgG